jgi:hypothetical protein
MKDAPYAEHDQPVGDAAEELSIVDQLPQKRATFRIVHAVSLIAISDVHRSTYRLAGAPRSRQSACVAEPKELVREVIDA